MVAIKFDSNKFDRKQRRMLSKSKKSLDKLYETFYKEVAKIGATTGFDDPERDFFLKDYPKADKAMQALLRKLCDRITGLIEDGCQEGWSISNAKNSALISALGNIVPDRKDFISRVNMRSESALSSFQGRKVNGMGLSERVWKSQQQVKGQIELALELGLAEGKSAPTLSRDVRSYLREPERLFRRVRDKKGHLRLSKSAAAFHPGQGVYRSSYKNALRMTVTENNIAYRTADFVQQQEMDFVIGIEIRLSDNHPCDDICDDLAGVYPKKFKFTGWHPFCRCYTIPKLAEREELNKWARMSKEERAGYHFKGEVRSMPKKFTDWVDRNAERIKSAKSLPYFIKDNYVGGNIDMDLSIDTSKDFQKPNRNVLNILRDSAVSTDMAGIEILSEQATLDILNYALTDGNRMKKIIAKPMVDAYAGYDRAKKMMMISNETIPGTMPYNPMHSLQRAFAKIKKGEPLDFIEEYSIETVHHEKLHSLAKGWIRGKSVKSVNVVEATNQLCARHSYEQTLKKFGYKPTHKQEIIEGGLGYNYAVTNLRTIIKRANMNEEEAVALFRMPLLKKRYNNLEICLEKFFKSKGIDNIKYLFEHITDDPNEFALF